MPKDVRSPACAFAAAAVLVFAAATRLYHLDVPSLWWDEILVPLNARFDVASIVNRCLTQDFHPPGFYLFTKFSMLAGVGNGMLRLPSVLFSLLAIGLMYHWGKAHLGPGPAVIASSLLASNILFLLVSRQVRPYAIIVFLSLAAVHCLLRYLDERSMKWLLGCLAACAAAAMVHYTALLLAGSVWAVLIVSALARPARTEWRGALAFGLGLTAIVGMVLPFLEPSLSREPGVVAGAGRLALFGLILERLGQMLQMDSPTWPKAVLACATAAGLTALTIARRRIGLAFLGLTLAPPAALLAAAYGTYFNPWHLLFMAPHLFLAAGYALALPLRRTWLQALFAVCLAGASAVYFLTVKAPRFYGEESHTGTYQGTARELLGRIGPGALYMPPDEEFLATLNWYLDQYATPNPVREQHLGPGDQQAVVEYVTDGRYWIFADNEKKVLAAMPRPVLDERWANPAPAPIGPGSGSMEKIRRRQYRIPREPLTTVAALPFSETMDFAPERFFQRVHSLRDVCVYPMNGFALAATGPGRTGHAQFEYAMPGGVQADRLDLSLEYANAKGPHRLRVLAAFDAGPFEELVARTGRDSSATASVSVQRPVPFTKLAVRFELWLAPDTPSYHGEYIQHLLLKGFSLSLASGGAALQAP